VATASPIESQSPSQLSVLNHRASSKFQAPGFLRLWHLASLDAPTVAVVWALAFAHAANVQLPRWLPVLLALGTWAVYIGDRLLDVLFAARRATSPLRERHHFHWKHRRLFLSIAATASAAALAITLLYMPMAARQRNSVLGVAALAYFAGVHGFAANKRMRISSLLPKELLVALIFTLACTTPTIARIGHAWFQMLPAMLCFTLLAWLNCHAIELWESSAPTQRTSIFRLGTLLAALCTATAAALAILHLPREAVLSMASASSALLLAMLDRRAPFLTPVTLRAAADFVLLTPAFLLWFR